MCVSGITEGKKHACTIGYSAMRVRELKALSLSGTFNIEGSRSESSVDLRLHACDGLKPLQDDARWAGFKAHWHTESDSDLSLCMQSRAPIDQHIDPQIEVRIALVEFFSFDPLQRGTTELCEIFAHRASACIV